jgi:small subunit ribosomal protein S17|tara:strand:- start:77 stop:343 length:267 start_codon:yes stop_codon:yes gene_type:complete
MTDNLKRTKVGSVISLSGDKSRVALIQRTVKHELLGKIMKRSTKISFHDEENVSSVGDKVKIKETKPISKNKSWELVEVIKKYEGASE